MRVIISSIFLMLSGMSLAQQSYTGIVTDNGVSSLMATFNPSTIVDSRSKFAVGVFANRSVISNFSSKDYIIYGTKSKYIDSKNPGYRNSYLTLDLLNLKYELNHKNAIGYSLRFRIFENLRGMPDEWAKSSVDDYTSHAINVSQNLNGLHMTSMYFSEHNFTYARTIFDRQTSLLKAGATLKILNGVDASYLYINSGTGSFTDSSSGKMNTSQMDVEFGSAKTKYDPYYKNRGVGFDVGITYEYRPDYEKQYYDMDGSKRNVRYDINKYKWKITASLTDIGRIRYMNDSSYYNFNIPSIGIDAKKIINVNSPISFPFNYIKDSIQANATKSTTQSKKFYMNLPASLHAGFDLYVMRDLYVSYNMSLPLSMKNDHTAIRNYFIHTVTPRLERKNWSVMLPMSQMGNGKFYVGAAGRFMYKAFTVFAGTNNLSFFYGQKSSLSRNIFAGISYNVWYKVPDDRDGDKISDEKDACPYDPGLPEYKGCPDTDGDGIVDHEDLCIYDKGPRSTHGCPDTDGDGIIDMNDMCPTEKGLGIHYGCSDSDKDGVIDAADRCPDVPGVELNNGCPLEVRGCCVDEDGDGVPNDADKCPTIPGSLYNAGCPIDSTNLQKIPLQQEKEKKDANNTGQQTKENPEIDPRKQLVTTQDELAAILADKKIIRNHAAYFDVDEATLTEEEQKRLDMFVKSFPRKEKLAIILIGYTDRDGSLDYNLTLSKKRAETIQRKLVELYGFDAKLITVYYFGETKSIHKGDYSEEQKQADRKVEIKLVRLPK